MSRGPKAWLTPEAQARLERVLAERIPADVIAARFNISPNHARNLALDRVIKLMKLEEFRGAA